MLLLTGLLLPLSASAQDIESEDDIWKEVGLSEVDFQRSRNYCLRLYGYFRCVDDGVGYIKDREMQLYRVNEGICELDVRYAKDEDDGAEVIVSRNLVHPDKKDEYMEYYELKPYTFLEKARKMSKTYTMQTAGDTTKVYTKYGLAGIAVRDTANAELRMNYNALSPDTALTLNLVVVRGHLSHVDAEAVYRIDDSSVEYVPQGNLKHVVFEGDVDISVMGQHEKFHERTELYVDSVVYMTKDEYKASNRTPLKQRGERYVQMGIDALKQKLGVPPLPAAVMQRMEEQRDWDEQYEQWIQTERNRRQTEHLQ